MIGKTNALFLAGEKPKDKYETLVINFKVSEGDINKIKNAMAVISYDKINKTVSFNEGTASIQIPAGKIYIITFTTIDGFTTPSSQSFTAVADNNRVVNATYVSSSIVGKCENVTISLSVSDNLPISSLKGASINVTYDSVNNKYIFDGTNNITFKIPEGAKYTISFNDFDGFDHVESQTFTSVGDNSRVVKATYYKTKVNFETVIIEFARSDEQDVSSLSGAVVQVEYGSIKNNYTFDGKNNIKFHVTNGYNYIVKFFFLGGFKAPEELRYKAEAGKTRVIPAVYTKVEGGFEDVVVDFNAIGGKKEDLYGVTFNVRYGDNQESYTYNGEKITFRVPQDVTYFLSFIMILGYDEPLEKSFVAVSGYTRNISVDYTKKQHSNSKVYIIKDNGEEYTKEDWDPYWNDSVLGILVLNDNNHNFIISPNFIDFDVSQWGTQGELIENIVTSNSGQKASEDLNGENNTNEIISQSTTDDNAAKKCRDYIFKNGKKGYLGSLGEWKLAYEHFQEINNCLEAAGCEPLLIDPSQVESSKANLPIWTSTQHSSSHAWSWWWKDSPEGKPAYFGKVNKYWVRPLCKY